MITREEFEKLYECDAYSIYTKGWDAGYAECCVDNAGRTEEAYKKGQHDGFIAGCKVQKALNDFAKAHSTHTTTFDVGDEVVIKNSSAVGIVVKVWEREHEGRQCVNVLNSDGDIYGFHDAKDYDKIGHYNINCIIDGLKKREYGEPTKFAENGE